MSIVVLENNKGKKNPNNVHNRISEYVSLRKDNHQNVITETSDRLHT